MALFTWSDDYSVNIRVVDDQHKKLVALINELHDGMRNQRSKEVLGKVLAGLIEYTRTHFSMEERLFEQYKYPGIRAHKALHNDLLKQVEDIHGKYNSGLLTLSIEVSAFLKKWLKNHILIEDKKYAKDLNSKGMF